MHGPGVASLLVGKNCGVAPEARLHYWTTPSGIYSRWEHKAEALTQIINYNKTVEERDRIRVVSCSTGYPNDVYKGDLNLWIQTIEKAKAAGIVFIDVHDIFDLNFIGGGSSTDKDNTDEYKEYLWADGDESFTKDKIIVPSDYRTRASSCNKKDESGVDEYTFNGRGGISWSVPYLAGIFSLMLQIKSDLKMDEMVKIIKDTVVVNKVGLKIINPKGIIESVRSL